MSLLQDQWHLLTGPLGASREDTGYGQALQGPRHQLGSEGRFFPGKHPPKVGLTGCRRVAPVPSWRAEWQVCPPHVTPAPHAKTPAHAGRSRPSREP